MWNTNKEGGWKRYLELTDDSAELNHITEQMDHSNSEEMMIQVSRRMEKIKFQSFGKVKKKVYSMETDKELSKLYEQKDNGNCEHEDIDQLINNKLHEHQLKNYEKKLSDLKRLKTEKGRSAGVFKLKEKIVGSKKTNQEAVTMKDPDSGELIEWKMKN